MNGLANITIGINPNIFEIGGLVLSWHGFMTFVAVATAVFLVVRWGSRQGLVADSIYSVAVWGIIGGVIGARLLHVIDFWGEVYQDDPLKAFYAWQGGVTIYGAILGGFAGGALYIYVRNAAWFLSIWGRYFRFLGSPNKAPLPGTGRLADLTAPALLLAQAIGRVGDIINGEHCAAQTDLPWAIVYTHEKSPGLLACGTAPTHPAVAYEMLFDLALLAILWPLRNRLRPHGMFFTLYLACYSIGRFFISFIRVEFNEYFGALNEAQIVALVVMLVTIPLLVYKAKLVRPAVGAPSS
jgi:phosphatidylglycerol:prolipoprotein diacylglycerol transferase|tara:strand:- start:589 stop:1479 length:891 start_codon:yes stop_codon:yes gene_type:complete